MPRPIFVIGVSGAGKSTLARALARSLGRVFIEGDDFHSDGNKARMAAGLPLDDSMRAGWLDSLAAAARAGPDTGRGAVLSCSALRRAYRDRLRAGAGPLALLWLDGPADLIAARLARRKGHFASPALLDSQFATLEPPQPDEADTFRIDASLSRQAQLALAITALG